jgi:hypothetical protein
MADYCYIPPFVTDPNTPPNLMFVYEKGDAIAKRAYDTTYTYNASSLNYGFFDSSSKYYFSVDGNKNFSPNYFEKSSICSPATDKKCISGDVLNWALMTSLDLTRKALVGFGWPKALSGQGAGDVFTYSGNFCSAWTGSNCTTQDITPLSYGQYEDGTRQAEVSVTLDTNGDGSDDYTYKFCMKKGNPESFVTVNGQAGTTAPSCPNPNTAAKCKTTATCLGAGTVAMKLTSEKRTGLFQKYADKDSNYVYDSDATRFALRRWKTSTAADERDRDILCDNPTTGNCTSTTKTTLLKEFLNAFSKEPGIDPDDPKLGTMMKDVINYFSGNSSTYEDKDSAYTQTPYKWSESLGDPATKCRDTVVVFLTTGEDLGDAGDALDLDSGSSTDACDNLTYSDAFVKNACYGYQKDLSTQNGTQNIKTFIVHTIFYVDPPPNEAKLQYAAEVGKGEYIEVNNPKRLEAAIEEIILNILATSSSASTVATLTTQTRESSTLTQAYFYPKREGTPLKWVGYLRLLWSDDSANLREDVRNTGWLDLKNDRILSFYYDETGCNGGPCYRSKVYNDADNDMKIDSCAVTSECSALGSPYTGNCKKSNDDVSTIWNAQDKLLATSPNDRLIKVGVDTASGSGGIVRANPSEFFDFEVDEVIGDVAYDSPDGGSLALYQVLRPYWSYDSYCSDYTTRFCAQNTDCNYCTTLRGTYIIDRGCTAASDCYYCDGSKSTTCTTTLTCIKTSDGLTITPSTDLCTYAGDTCSDGTNNGVCVGECYIYKGTCTGGSLVCNDDYATTCTTLGQVGAPCGATATCVRNCSIDTSVYCSADSGCINDYRGSEAGTGDGCITTDTCTAAAGTCVQSCDDNCAKSVIKYIRGYDLPSYSGSASTSPGNEFRVRTQCDADSDCPGGGVGSCSSKYCSNDVTTSCTSDSDCELSGKCYGTCSSVSYDVTQTLKLGDIVYSTPRISPNSAVNGYDITYQDTSYSNFIKYKINGKCDDSNPCLTGETCSNGICQYSSGSCSSDSVCPRGTCIDNKCVADGYTPIVIVGANDGMVHAFKVSKLKDIDPAEDECFGEHSTTPGSNSCADPPPDVTAGEGHQVARFADRPSSTKSDTAPTNPDKLPPSDIGKELWAYIPHHALPYLAWYCEETYCHIPMVDARFTVMDASIDYNNDGSVGMGISEEDKLATDTRTKDSWRRILIGAMGVGGKEISLSASSLGGTRTWSSSIFLLDITNPANPQLLWERPLPDKTLTTATPAIVRLGEKDKNGKWYLVIGSGPTAVETNTVSYKTGDANIYVFDLRTGEPSATLPITGASGVAVGDMMAVDMDSDYQVDAVYFGTYGGTGASQTGKFYRLRIRADGGSSTPNYQTPSGWDIETVINVGRPIYASAEIAVDESNNKWLYFGTGLYLTLEHASPTAKCTSVSGTPSCTADSDCSSGTCDAVSGYLEYLYGFRETDRCWKGSTTGGSCASLGSTTTPSYSNFLDTTNFKFTDASATEVSCYCAGNKISSTTCNAANEYCKDVDCGSKTCSDGTGGCSGINVGSPCDDGSGVCVGQDRVITGATGATLTGDTTTGCNGQKDETATECISNYVLSNTNGWKRAIKGQKIFSRPFIGGGLANFTSFQPTATSCSLGGNTHLIALHYTSGAPYSQPALYMSGGTSGTGADLTISASVNLGTGVPPLGESLVALPLTGDTYKVITQVSGGLPGTNVNPAEPATTGYVLWITK